MSIGRITVDLLAKTGSFETSLDRAAKHAAKRAKEIDNAVSKAGVAVGAALSAAGIAAVYFGKQLIDGLDALNDYSDATGASIENLSALEDVAVRTGASMDTVSGILTKFNNVLKEADGKNAAGQALKALGLSAEELKKIDPAEALRQTAVALSGFADDGNKARLVQELFGKSIKDAAPFLKDLAEQTSLVGKTTSAQTQAAEDFNKSLFALQKNAADAGRSLLQNLLPAMNEIIKAFNSGGLSAGIDALGNKMFDWEGNAARKGINNLKGDIASLQDAANNITFDIFGQKGKIQQDIEAKTAALKAAEASYFKLNSAAGGGRGSVNPPLVEGRASLPSITAVGGGKAATAKESEYQKYLENLGKQLDKIKEMTVAETVLADISSGRLKLGKGESQEVLLTVARQVDAAKALSEYTKLSAAAEEERASALFKLTAEQETQSKSLMEGNKTLREEVELIGKNVEAQAAIEQARLSSAIAMKQEELVRRENAGALIRETDAIRAQIEALTERKDLVGMRGVAQKLADDAAEAKQFASQVGAAFESSFEKAILEGGKLSDVLKGLAKDILGLYIRNSITGPLAKSIGGAAGGFNFGSLTALFSGTSLGSSGFGTGLAYGNQDFGGFFADGGNPPLGKFSVVGENGPELFVPNTSGTIIPNHALGGGGAPTVNNYNFTVGDVATASMVREAVANSERRTANGFRRSRSYAGEAA